MKQLISAQDCIYKYFVEVNDVNEQKHVAFYTNFSGAKDPEGLHKKFEFFLEKGEFDTLKKILGAS